jgi:hypothetical protein
MPDGCGYSQLLGFLAVTAPYSAWSSGKGIGIVVVSALTVFITCVSTAT